MTQYDIKTRHGNIHTLEQGAGKPVIFLHGWSIDGYACRRVLHTLGKRYRVIVPTMPGFHPSFAWKKRVNQQWMTEAMTDWFDAVDLVRPVLIGHSLGGVNAMLLASERQSILRELILIDTVGIPLASRKSIDWQRAWVKKRAQSFSMYGLSVPFTIDRSFVKQVLVRPKQLTSLSTFATQVDCAKVAKTITVPTLIVWGAEDYFTPITIGETLVSILAKGKIKTVPGNHDWPIFNPDPLLEILEAEGY